MMHLSAATSLQQKPGPLLRVLLWPSVTALVAVTRPMLHWRLRYRSRTNLRVKVLDFVKYGGSRTT